MKAVTEEDELRQAVDGRRTAVLFHATWCPFCRSYRPVFDEVMTTRGGGWEPVEAILDDEENVLWDRFDIDVVPTVLFFEDGEVVNRVDGRPGQGLTAQDLARVLQ